MTSRSNVLYDVELRLRSVTLEDVRSFLRDTQRLDSHGCAFSVPNRRGPLKSLFGSVVQKRWVRV